MGLFRRKEKVELSEEAIAFASAKIDTLRSESWESLQRLMSCDAGEFHDRSGTIYQWEVCAAWDGKKGGDLRVWMEIYPGFWPLTGSPFDDFIKGPDGSFVGE